MNTLGLLLVGTVARVTVLAALGAILAAALRRRGTAVGSAAALSTLTALVAVTVFSLSPWPRFWTLDLEPGPRLPRAAGLVSPATAPRAEPPAPGRQTAEGTDLASLGQFAREFTRALQDPSQAPATPGPDAAPVRWRWPAWLAAGFLSTWAFGLTRFALALIAVRGVRRRSRPVEDAGLLGDAARLSTELGVSRGVDLRVSDELTAPATVGWVRPALLLPPDWPRWDAPERRAVLAHELAHVRRGDYLSGLWAQLCLAFHVYHPLAHWLAARLRLEQELLADAWGARLVGGNRPYLQVLARLALRRSEPSSVRLAQPFLPSRNAFLRRIEMLRDAKCDPRPPGPMSVVGRWLTTAAIAAAALTVSGLRGPAGLPAALGQQADDRKAELRKQVQGLNDQIRELERQEAAKGAKQGGPYDLSRVPAGTVLAVVGRPADIFNREELKPVIEVLEPLRDALAGLPFAEVDWITVLLTRSADRAGQLDTIRVLHTAQPLGRKAALGRIGATEEVRHNGRVLYRRPSGSGPVVFAPDDHTLVVGQEPAVLALADTRSEGGPVGHAWDAAWSKLTVKGQAAVVVDAGWLAASMPKDARPGTPQAALGVLPGTIAPLFEKATGYAAALTIDPRLEVDVVATCPSAQDATTVRETTSALLTLGRNAVRSFKAQAFAAPPGQREAATAMLGLFDTLLADAKASPDPGDGDRVVRFRARTDQDAAALVNVVLPAIVAARAAALTTMSTNNLRQIGLAMHNYESANVNFPPAVLTGPDGKTRYSWRVALLPYLGQVALFRQYNLNEPWDSPGNLKVMEQMPAVFRHPADTRGGHFTSYFVPVGTDTIFPPGGAGTKLADVVDGTSNTLLTVEAKREIPWTKPEDVTVTPMADPKIPSLGGFTPGSFLGGMADGSVRAFSLDMNPTVFKALFSRAGGEVIDVSALPNPDQQPPSAPGGQGR